MKAQKGSKIYNCTVPSALGGRGWLTPRPDRFTPGKDSASFVKGAGWAPDRSGRMRNPHQNSILGHSSP
jgi:hypothetical protein